MANLIYNGDFDQGFYPYRNDDALQVAIGWAPWWLGPRPGDPQWKNRQPVFDSAWLDNQSVQRLASPYATHTAGLLQQLPAAPGNKYEFTIEGQAWSSEDDLPASHKEASDVNLQIGLDPTGGQDASSPLIEWSDMAQPLSRWETLRLITEAQAATITLFLRSAPSLPKKQQTIFWRNATLTPLGRYRRSITIVGPGDTHINITPETPEPDQPAVIEVSSTRNHAFIDLLVRRPDNQESTAVFQGIVQKDGRTHWRYSFTPLEAGLFDIRFVSDRGSRLLAQRLLQVTRQTQIVPGGSPRTAYHRVYVLLPPTADKKWAESAARGSFEGRYTIGYSADDAGLGELDERVIVAVNPHHWPGVLTASWFQQHYPGTKFVPVVANSPKDLEIWLQDKSYEFEQKG